MSELSANAQRILEHLRDEQNPTMRMVGSICMVLLLDTPDWEAASTELLEQNLIATNGTSFNITPAGTQKLAQIGVVKTDTAPPKPEPETKPESSPTIEPEEPVETTTHPFVDYLVAFNHDLRSPLNSIIGFSRVILKGIDGPINDMQAEDLQSIYDSGQKLLGMLAEVVDMARLETGVVTAQPKQISLERIFNKLIETLEEQFADKPITFHCTLPPNGLEIYTDQSRLEQILTNLTNFCIRNLEVGSVFLRANRQDEKVRIEVEDTGNGWPAQEVEVMLDAYRPPEEIQHIGGAGLSLAIARRLAGVINGKLTVESRVGKGTTFSLVLPLQSQTSEKKDESV